MTHETIAETYATDHGLRYQQQARLPRGASFGGGSGSCWSVMAGPIAGILEGTLYRSDGARGIGPPAAQFAIGGLEAAIDGLWVRRCGRSILTRVKLPHGYTELMLSDEAYMGRFRVAIASPAAEAPARALLDPGFTQWHLEHGPQGNSLSQAGSLEISAGILFIRGDQAQFKSAETIDGFAVEVAGLAQRVAAFAANA